ncbi:hypothetical protein HMI56_002851 [Coelomomyces lativittatus]|nr:hypothetical protein HMI56_002851 [Coelomomyces lativittatus]
MLGLRALGHSYLLVNELLRVIYTFFNFVLFSQALFFFYVTKRLSFFFYGMRGCVLPQNDGFYLPTYLSCFYATEVHCLFFFFFFFFHAFTFTLVTKFFSLHEESILLNEK